MLAELDQADAVLTSDRIFFFFHDSTENSRDLVFIFKHALALIDQKYEVSITEPERLNELLKLKVDDLVFRKNHP